ncbi:MAG TPA: tryptophan--tRNA ligase [Firmicutes bacterium]|nr:tryptophan--tRNA ligase [Bacillota bacterium]
METKKRIFSGMRPTGKLHLGNYFGALSNWVRLQDTYQCVYAVVDWHALTTGYEDTSGIRENVYEMALDWLAAGLDPERSIIFVQSHVKQHAELHLLLSMVTPLGWVERVPTYKEQLRELAGREIATYGFLGYPVLQAADILAYKAEGVPVGEDQVPHVELTREIARRFNHFFGPIFPEPETLLTHVKLLPGVDGRKMSKSYGNEIAMTASSDEIRNKVMNLVTDPERIHRTDPGHPDVCIAYKFYEAIAQETATGVSEECRNAKVGCVQCKRRLFDLLEAFIAPLRERREEYAKDPDFVRNILAEGASRAQVIAEATLNECREAMKLW